MAQPSPYDRQVSFTLLAAENPSDPYTGADLDEEFNSLKVTVDEILENLALIQRDDGDLANSSVGLDQLGASAIVGFDNSAWLTATAYTTTSSVFQNASLYKCIVAHTSGVFATDLAAAKWELVAAFGAYTIADGSVTTAKLDAGAVTTAKLASLSVDTGNIIASAVSTAKIAASAVTYSKIQNVSATDKILGRSTAGAGVVEEIAMTAFGRSLVDDAAASNARTTLGLVIGTDVQAFDTQLGQIAALSIASGDLLYGSATNTVSNLAKATNGNFLKLASGLPAWGVAGLIGVQVFTTGSGTYTPTTGARSGIAFVTGGGGGGGGAATNNLADGGGGGGGATAIAFVAALAAVSYTVGAAGTAGANTGTSGGAGGQSIFGTITANGGSGGTGSTAASTSVAGGAGSATTANATLTIAGGPGQYGYGTSGAVLALGAGGGTFWGSAANMSIPGATGIIGADGPVPGAGGEGGYRISAAFAGGAGAVGVIVVLEFS